MLKQTQGALDDNVLEDGARRDINGATLAGDNDDGTLEDNTAAEVDGTGNGKVVKLEDLGDRRNVLLEVRDLLEVAAELDERSITKAVGAHLKLAVLQSVEIRLDEHEIGAGLDREETATGHVDTVGVVEVTDGGTNSSLELHNGNVRLALLVAGDGLAVGDNLHLELVVLDNALDGAEVEPDVVGVEVLELLDGLEVVDVLLGDLGNLEQADGAVVVNDGTTLDVSLGLVGKLHDVLGLGLHHVLKDTEIDNGTQVVHVGEEDDLNALLEELVEDARVVEGLENVTVARRVPLANGRVVVLGDGELRVLEDSGVSGLVEGEDVDVVALVLFDDGSGVVVGVERVHQDEGDVDVVCAVEVFDLTDGKVEEGHAVTDLDDGLGTDATHGGTETTVELEDGELVEELDRLGVGEVLVVDDLTGGRRADALPVTAQREVLAAANTDRAGCGRARVRHTQRCPWPCRSGSGGRGQRSCPSQSRTAVCGLAWVASRPCSELELTFFCLGSSTVSARLVRALRIWAAATLVEVFSKACASWVRLRSMVKRYLAVGCGGEKDGRGVLGAGAAGHLMGGAAFIRQGGEVSPVTSWCDPRRAHRQSAARAVDANRGRKVWDKHHPAGWLRLSRGR